MADFTKQIKIVVDTVIGKGASDVKALTKGFTDLRTEVNNTQGAFGKVKTAVSGSLDVLTSSTTGGLALASAFVAIDKVALGAANQFADLGVAIQKFSAATGTSVEEASRWVEVSKDLGLSADTVEGAMGRLNKQVGAAPAKYAELGITAKSSNDRFLQAIEILQSTDDATQQAALGAQFFGKSWQAVAPLIAQGAGDVAQRLAAVQDSKIYDAKKVAESRKFKDDMDAVTDAIDGLKQSLGSITATSFGPILSSIGTLLGQAEKLASLGSGTGGSILGKVFGNMPGIGSLSGVATAVGDNVDNIDRLKGAATAVLPPLKLLPGGLFDVETGAEKSARKLKELTAAAKDVQQGLDIAGREQAGFVGLLSEGEIAAQKTAAAQKDLAESAKKQAEAQKKAADEVASVQGAYDKLGEGLRSLATEYDKAGGRADAWASAVAQTDVALANTQLIADRTDALKALTDGFKENGDSLDVNTEKGRANLDNLEKLNGAVNTLIGSQLAQGASYDDVRASAATYRSELEKQLRQAGLTKAQIDQYIATLGLTPEQVETKIKLTGQEEARLKIEALNVDYNNLPVEVSTDVRQKIIKGDYTGALNDIQFYYDHHPVTVRVNAAPGTFFNPAAVHVRGAGQAQGGVTRMAGGGTVPVLVGERGPELVGLPEGSQVVPAERLDNLIRQSVQATFHVQNPTARLSGPQFEQAVIQAMRKFQRRNGEPIMGTRH